MHHGSYASTGLGLHSSQHASSQRAARGPCHRHICRQRDGNGTDTLTAMESEQPHGSGFNGGPSPSAVFQTARMQVPLFQALSEKEGQPSEGISVEHIPGFASVGSNIYEVQPHTFPRPSEPLLVSQRRPSQPASAHAWQCRC